MAANKRRRQEAVGTTMPAANGPVVAIVVRGERFEVAPAPGYGATVIQLAEFDIWLDRLKDATAQARIAYAIGKMARGVVGDWKEVGGIYETRIDYGPGYRVYFGKHGDAVFVIALGGDKSTQQSDIAKALDTWRELKMASKRFETDLRERLRHPEFAAAYLAAAMEDDDTTDSVDGLLHTLREIALSREGGISGVARQSHVGRQTIYDGFKVGGNPQIRSVNALLKSIGVRLTVEPIREVVHGEHVA